MARESFLTLQRDARRARRDRRIADQQQRRRFAELVAFARSHSSFYRDLYRDLPDAIDDVRSVPFTSKRVLMERFDEWVTDPAIRLADLRRFVDDAEEIGKPFRAKYTISTTSGTTGTKGIFVLDDHTMTVTNVVMLRVIRDWLDFGDIVKIAVRGGRIAIVMASGGHFASAVAAARMRATRRGRKRIGAFSVQMPIPELVTALDAFRPAVLAPYASMASILATEQEAGRLHISPVLLALSAEGLPAEEYTRIAKVFGAKVGNTYAATECTFLSHGCSHGWLHVNSDWVMVEPVDDQHRPVAPGVQSHTVLISNLANRVQPVIRYDLGDSVLERPDACPCGNPLPAIRVQGRAADVLTFDGPQGENVSIAPLAFGTTLDRIPGIEQFQIVQAEPMQLIVRLRPRDEVDVAHVSPQARAAIAELLVSRGLDRVTVSVAEEPPAQGTGGKFRQVVPYAKAKKA